MICGSTHINLLLKINQQSWRFFVFTVNMSTNATKIPLNESLENTTYTMYVSVQVKIAIMFKKVLRVNKFRQSKFCFPYIT